MNYQFGSGKLFTKDVSGSIVELADVSDVELDFNVQTKRLPGAYRYALSIADSEGDIKITTKAAHFYAAAFNLVWGGTLTNGAGNSFVSDEIGVVSGGGTYVLAKGANYVAKTAIVWLTPPGTYSSITRQLTRTTGAPAAGISYSENAGTGTLSFHTADQTATVRVTYQYSLTSGVQTITIANPLTNSSVGVALTLLEQSLNRQIGQYSTAIITLNNVILPGLKLGFKYNDWTIPDYSLEASADANNQIGTGYFYNWDL